MARCAFCHKKFLSKQSVRAHLRHCETYKNRETQGRLPIGKAAFIGRHLPKAEKETGFDPAVHARQQVEQEEARLRLRQLQAAHLELDMKEADRQRRERQEAEAAATRARDEASARERARLEVQERKQKEEAEADRQRRRREIFQEVKDRVIRRWWRIRYTIPSEVQAQALKEIEQELSALAVEELPETELIEIAEGVRDRLYRPVMAAQDEAQGREEERERQERARALEESMAKLQETAKSIRLDREKDELIGYADRFASEELDERGIRPGFERYAILEKVKDELRKRLTGVEDKSDTEDLVEAILAEELEEN